MIGRRSIIGIVSLCALVVGAFATAGASAGGRAYTCQPVASGATFTDEHCTVPTASGGVGFKHFLITEKTKNTLTNAATLSTGEGKTNAASVPKLRGTISGVETEVQCTTVAGSGELENAVESVTGSDVIEYTGCTVTKPAGRGCVVTGGAITTKKLSITTVGLGENAVKITPFEGTQFAVIPIASCLENIPPAASYPVTGSLVATASGATLSTTHAGVTTQGTLKFGGQVAGLEGAVTNRMKPEAGKESNPIVLTK